MSRRLTIASSVFWLLVLSCFAYLSIAKTFYDADTYLLNLDDELTTVRDRLVQTLAEIETLKGDAKRADALIVSGNLATISAAQQENARNAVSASGGQLVSVQSVVVDLGGGYKKSALVVHARVSEPALLSFLRAQEAAALPTAVEALDVQQMPGGVSIQQLDMNITLAVVVADASSD